MFLFSTLKRYHQAHTPLVDQSTSLREIKRWLSNYGRKAWLDGVHLHSRIHMMSEAKGSGVLGHPQLRRGFEASLDYM